MSGYDDRLTLPGGITAMNAEGYVSDVLYTSHFFREQAPGLLNEVRRFRSLPETALSQPFTWCDLGCGTGYTTALLAAAHPQGKFYGVDFLPEHIRAARDTAEGLPNAVFVEAGFEEFLASAERDGLTFDFITLHGVMSYVREQTRGLIRQMVERLLKADGTLYVSYNAQPGWAAQAPVQRLLRTLAAAEPAGDSACRLESAARRALELERAGAGYFQQVPTAGDKLRAVLAADSSYPVHEYMSEQWQAFHHAEIAAYFSGAGRAFLGSATMTENYPAHLLPPDQWALVKQERDPALREMLKDFLVNTTFRRDVFGPLGPCMSESAAAACLGALQFRPLAAAETWRQTLRTPAGRLDPDLAGCFHQAAGWSGDSPGLAECARLAGRSLKQIHDAASFLVQTGQAFWITDAAADPGPARKFNRRMASRVFSGLPAEAFAVPGCGTGAGTDLLERLAIHGRTQEGLDSAPALANFLDDSARKLGRTLRRQGQPIEEPAARRALLQPMAETFLHQRWPALQRLGIF